MNRMKLFAAALGVLLAAGAPASASAQAIAADAGFGAGALGNCRTDLRNLNQLFGWQVTWGPAWQSLQGASDEELRRAIAEWRNAPAALRTAEETLAAGRREEAAPRVIVERIIPQVEALAASVRSGAPALRSDADPELKAQWTRLFAEEIAPALDRYLRFLREDYLPLASAEAGIGRVPDGVKCFRNSVKYFTTLDIPPEDVERIGWRILNQTKADLAKLYGVKQSALPGLLERLRGHREAGFDRAQLRRLSEVAIARATAAIPKMFAGTAKRAVTVEALPGQMEESFPAGYYRPGQGSGPAAYVINLSRPEERRLMAEVIAFHETLPGHHLRQALDLPRGEFNSGFGEGWAIYAEYLADEFGLYGSRLDRAGMMAKHLWAASRLVVEPGLHVRGWSRDRAVQFMRAHTALSDAEIALEVDRYISTPGQSLSYMLGYDRFATARRYAEQKMGRKFDLRDFHARVLAKGSRPLDEVQADVVAWADGASKRS